MNTPTAVVALHEGDEVALIPPVSGGSGARRSPANAAAALRACHAGGRARSMPAAILAQIKRPEDGAVATFDGIVRNNSRGRRTLYLDYSGYEPMALRKMEAARRRRANAFRDSRCAHRAPAGTLTDRRKQRLYCSFVGASRGGLRCLPLVDRHAEDHGADLEERTFRRRGGVVRRRTLSAGDPACRARTRQNSANGVLIH